MQLDIISPDRVIFSGKVTSVQLPGKDGLFEILNNHAPIISLLKNGEIRIIKEDGSKEYFETDPGFVECVKNKVTVLV